MRLDYSLTPNNLDGYHLTNRGCRGGFIMPKNRLIVSSLVREFREDYFNVRGETPSKLCTYETSYQQVFKNLPPKRVVTESMLRELILSKPADSKQRRKYTLACSMLADFAGIEHNLRRLSGNYSTKMVSPRDIPDDATIAYYYSTIPNPHWKYVYGLMATYGMRNCEVFLMNLKHFPEIEIASCKRGEARFVSPLYPEWVEQFDLKNGTLPKCSGKNNGELGNRVTHAFIRYKIPFSPYNLRHAWARRSLEFGMDRKTASVMMGHDEMIHSQSYQRWLNGDVYRNAYQKVISDPRRPLAPKMKV